MKARGLAVGVLVCVLMGVLVVGAAAATAKKKPPVKKKTGPDPSVVYNCAKYVSAARLTALTGGWGGTYTLTEHSSHPARASWGGGTSACSYKPSIGYGSASVVIYYGTKNAAFSYGGTKQTATIRGKQNCANRVAHGNPVPTDPRQCAPVAIPGLGDKAFAMFGYIIVLRGQIAVLIAFPSMPDPSGNLTVSQDLVVSVATAIMSSIPATKIAGL